MLMRMNPIVRFGLITLLIMGVGLTGYSADPPADYVGSETCKECHEASYTDFAAGRHGTDNDPKTPASRMGCESCHGPGSRHAESEDPSEIINWSSKSAADVRLFNSKCISCHYAGKTALWSGGSHESRGMACTDCHRIHQNKNDNLLIGDLTSTCTDCHKKVKSEVLRMSHHPIKENKIECTDCHNPHGTIADKLINAQTIPSKCYECHAEKRGPHLWPHMPAIEDCLTCHTPHGSSHSPLLKTKMPYLCQRCHSNDGHAGELQARTVGNKGLTVYQASRNRLFYRSCTNCHSRIHGSNHPSGNGLLR